MLVFNFVNYVFLLCYIFLLSCYVFLLLCFSFVSLSILIVMYYVLFRVLFVCKCVLYDCHRVSTQLQLNISYTMYRKWESEGGGGITHIHKLFWLCYRSDKEACGNSNNVESSKTT
jgi:hypothetical protein